MIPKVVTTYNLVKLFFFLSLPKCQWSLVRNVGIASSKHTPFSLFCIFIIYISSIGLKFFWMHCIVTMIIFFFLRAFSSSQWLMVLWCAFSFTRMSQSIWTSRLWMVALCITKERYEKCAFIFQFSFFLVKNLLNLRSHKTCYSCSEVRLIQGHLASRFIKFQPLMLKHWNRL